MGVDLVQLSGKVLPSKVVDSFVEFAIGLECQNIGRVFIDASICKMIRVFDVG